MSHTTLSTAVTRTGTAPQAATSVLSSPAAVLVSCLVALAALVADAASGEAQLAIVGVAAMALALAVTMTQALRADVGRPSRTTRRAAATARAASVVVAAFLACVGVLERSGPQVTSSAAFAAGVAVMSVLLLVVLPLALVVVGWGVLRDRRLGAGTRMLPWLLVLVVAGSAVAVALTGGSRELWLQTAGVAAAGAALTGLSAGLSRATGRAGG